MNRLTTYALDLHRPVPSVRETGTLSTGRSVQACTVAVLSMCVLLLAACTDGSISSRSVATPVAAEVAVVRQARLPVTNDVTGSVVSDGRIDVASRVTGFIRQLDVREGQAVKRGELLVRIDAADIDAAIMQARAGVQAAREAWQDAQYDVNQNAQLVPAGAISADALRKSRVREETTRATLEQAQSALAAAQAQRNYVAITSPVDGVVVSVARRSGEMATPGAPLMTVESREVLLFKAFVPERSLAAIKSGDSIPVRIDALGDERFKGRVRGVVPSGDGVTRRYEVDIVLPRDARLLPGMFGRLEILLDEKQAVTVPRAALVRRGGLDGVFVVRDGVARFRWLRTGRELGDALEVTAGLSDGETILARAADTVFDGTPIRAAGGAQ
ncbi:efflux RND transporter periplasmic adaptor subunit [Diaphorobacter sp. JS3051]|uniref:efflux RND transporter periplasmic adaptor subunit n=1 Tax=Diaphorobacter sp. JS3051 TaxID=2792224 RepID=UPI0018CA3EB9|nr:efflux RND transporter periplasmic adaptor subunit [Diaphorobacter sp. JS3051]QPN31045.1 efflux RND transporter periplasmic adaptor subunit [Diaphorobacter sp. JS3051]